MSGTDPQLAAIVRSCVHCGFCTATCPTYVLLGDERDSPRGRIQLIKAMLAKGGAPDPVAVKHIDRCLSCLACTTTCPSGVDYMHLIDGARAYIQTHHRRPIGERGLRWLLALVLPRPGLLRLGLALAPLVRPIAGLLPRRLAVLAGLAAAAHVPGVAAADRRAVAAVNPAAASGPAPAAGRVALLTGCVQDVVARHVHHATVRLLNRAGVTVVAPAPATCCGALAHHLGREAAALASARQLLDRLDAEISGAGLDAVIINASGCGTVMKDYGHMFADDPVYAAKAARVAALVRDVSEYCAALPLAPRPGLPPLAVAYHPACSLNHGQRVRDEPRALIARMGFVLRPFAEEHLCCGSAGTYNILQPELAGQLRARKSAAIAATAADIMVSGNVGCNTQLAGALAMPVVNTAELLDWATGGPLPPAMAGRTGRWSALVHIVENTQSAAT